MPACDILLGADLVLTQNPGRECLSNASLAIKDGLIVDIGSTEALAKQWQARTTKNLSGMMLMPGLINAHTHAAMTFLRGLADDLPLLDWLEKHVFPIEAKLNADIVYLGSLLGHAEMLATGVTACIDMYIFEDAVFKAASLAGIRCLGGEAIFAFPSAACADYRQALDKTRELADIYKNNEKIKIAINPHSVYTTDAKILTDCLVAARELDSPLHIHLAETVQESALCQKLHGARPVAWCEQMGLFEAPTLAAHLVDVNESEAELMAHRKVCGIHNPSSNMKLASGASPVSMFLNKGLSMALGSDGAASNNRLNMFTEMGRAALMAKLASGDPSTMPAQTILDMATLGGARAFGDMRLGSLEKGKKADCIALDLKTPNLQPLHNPVSQIVYSATGMECRMTMVSGEIVYEDGKFNCFDYAALLDELKSIKRFVSDCKN